MKPHQDVIHFSPGDFEQLLLIQQELDDSMEEEVIQPNGERKRQNKQFSGDNPK